MAAIEENFGVPEGYSTASSHFAVNAGEIGRLKNVVEMQKLISPDHG